MPIAVFRLLTSPHPSWPMFSATLAAVPVPVLNMVCHLPSTAFGKTHGCALFKFESRTRAATKS